MTITNDALRVDLRRAAEVTGDELFRAYSDYLSGGSDSDPTSVRPESHSWFVALPERLAREVTLLGSFLQPSPTRGLISIADGRVSAAGFVDLAPGQRALVALSYPDEYPACSPTVYAFLGEEQVVVPVATEWHADLDTGAVLTQARAVLQRLLGGEA